MSKDVSEAREQVIQMLGRARMAQGTASAEAKGEK